MTGMEGQKIKEMIVNKNKFFALMLCSMVAVFYAEAQETEWTRIAKSGYKEYVPVTLANGIYGITVSEKALNGNQLQLNGIFDYFPEKGNESAIRGIDFTNLELIVMNPESAATEQADFLKGKVFSKAELSDLENWQQEFNMHEGWFKTNFVFEGLKVEHTLFALQNMAQTGIVKLTFTAQKRLAFSLKNILVIDHPYKMDATKYINQLRDRKIPLFTASVLSPAGKYQLATTSSFYFEGDGKPELDFANNQTGKPHLGFQKELQIGETFTCYLIGSVGTTYIYSNPIDETARLNIYAFLKGPEKVIAEHKASWREFWNKTDIVVEGQPEITKDLRQIMFFLNSFVRPGTDFSTACMGLGTDYWGYKTLWDADFWMYPAILLINPAAAKSMLEYRWKRLDMARQNAAAHGYKGAMFPWESGASGEDQTSLMYLTGPFQHHITSDVGLAFWYYYCVTQDKDWLQEQGYPLLKEVADFWISRAEKTDRGYEIKNVVSSDEHAINVDNDVFTNAAAISVLNAANNAAEILGLQKYEKWSEVADQLVIGEFENGISREHDSYNGEIIKQAATNLASFPLEVIYDKKQILRNLEYYEAKVDEHGPNMTWPMYAGAAARSDDPEKAKYYFEKGLLPYKKGPFSILSLRPYLTTTFFGTSAGGILQAFIMGFGGLHFSEEGLVQKRPVLPEEWKSIKMKGIGNGMNVEVKHSK